MAVGFALLVGSALLYWRTPAQFLLPLVIAIVGVIVGVVGGTPRRRLVSFARDARKHPGNVAFLAIVVGAAALIMGFLASLIVILWDGSQITLQEYGLSFLWGPTWTPQPYYGGVYGALPFIVGTISTSLIALAIAVPLSLGIAIFLSEMAPAWIRVPLSSVVDLLAAIPSVIYGFWGVATLVPLMASTVEPGLAADFPGTGLFLPPYTGYGILTSGIVLSIMIIPTISALSREALYAVPQSQREAALALGGTRAETTRLAVLKYARSGIVGGIVLGLGRAVGETMAVVMTISEVDTLPRCLTCGGATMASLIASEFLDPANPFQDKSALIEIALVLLLITLLINLAARVLIWRLVSRSQGVSDSERSRTSRFRRKARVLQEGPGIDHGTQPSGKEFHPFQRLAATAWGARLVARAREGRPRGVPRTAGEVPVGRGAKMGAAVAAIPGKAKAASRRAASNVRRAPLLLLSGLGMLLVGIVLLWRDPHLFYLASGLSIAGLALALAGLATERMLWQVLTLDGRRHSRNILVACLAIACLAIALVPLGSIIETALALGGPVISWGFLTGKEYPAQCQLSFPGCQVGGIGPAIQGTFILMGMSAVWAIPVSVLAAIFLSEYGRGPIGRGVSFMVDVMSGVPSIVIGLFVFTLFFFYDKTFIQSTWSQALALGIIMLPIVTRTAEEALKSVPHTLREAAWGLGIPQHKTVTRVVLRSGVGPMVTGALLAVARAGGETAPLLFLGFSNYSIFLNCTSGTSSCFDHPAGPLGPLIYNYAISGAPNNVEAAWGAALVFLFMMLALSLGARLALRGRAAIPAGVG